MEDKKRIINNWIHNNGAANFDLKNKNIILFDGGLFSIETKKVKRRKIVNSKKLLDGGSEIIFSKKKYNSTDYSAILWFEELDETINYFKRMKKMLNKLGYKTNHKK